MPLYRLYGSPKAVDAQIHGTGLGLAVAKRISEATEGSLSVMSEVGVGSTLTPHLPAPWQSDAEMAACLPESS